MTGAKLRLIVAALLFFGWLAWLGVAVSRKGTVQIVSRAQLAAATHYVIAEVTVDPDGTPGERVKIVRVLRRKDGPAAETLAGAIDVRNLKSAVTPLPVAGDLRMPPAGEYLLPLVKVGENLYRIAGLPRSPGYEAQNFLSPVIYPWTEDVKKQVDGILE